MVVVRLFSTIHSTVTTIQLHRKKVWQQTFFEIQALWFAAWQHQQQISTNEDNLQRQQEDEEIEWYHLVNDCIDDVQIYTPPPFASAGSRKSSEEPNLITAGSIGMIGKFEYKLNLFY
jgi:hypothetical protein